MTDEDKIERYEAALRRIVEWSEAYPLNVFPEPDWKRAGDLLRAGGINLDVISASNMRHVVEGVGRIAKEALQEVERLQSTSPPER
jgi:hypothetical protein